jgi:hypothetical protein
MFLAPNTSTSLQTTLAADAHLAEGQFLHEEQTLNKAKSLMYRAGTRSPTISKTERQNLAKAITAMTTTTTTTCITILINSNVNIY